MLLTHEQALRFVRRLTVNENDCWIWNGCLYPGGYGQVVIAQRKHRTHRVLYEAMRGPIPVGFELDHLCRTPACCNPNHLEVVTKRENILRGRGTSAVNARKTCCPRCGAEYEWRTFGKTPQGRVRVHRWCRPCRQAWEREWQRQRRREGR
jgi:HNH endonuclease